MSGPPSAHDIEVSIAALRHDADRWAGFSDAIETARTTVTQQLVLTTTQVTYDGTQFRDAYQGIRTKLLALLDDAEKNFTGVAAALRSAADQYEDDERRGLHQLNGIY